MQQLIFVHETGAEPAHCLASTAFMMEAVGKGRTRGAPFLKISQPEGEAVVLGRYQNAATAISRDVCAARKVPLLRRLTGGTAATLGAGRLYVALVLPDRNQPLECEPRQFLQRYGAGLVRGLVQAGMKARYFGKDRVSVEDRPVGIMSFELAPDGTALLEAILGLRSPWIIDGDISKYPPRAKTSSAAQAPTTVKDELASFHDQQLITEIREAMVGLLDVELAPREFTPLELERIRSLTHRAELDPALGDASPSYLRTYRSRPIEESIGFVEASVRLTQGRFLRDVSIYGDFMADSGGMSELESRLKMVPVKRRQVALVIDDVLGAPDHVIMGIRRLGSILEAILDAAKQGADQMEK